MTGIERLKKLVEGQEDKALLKIITYLTSREDLDVFYLNEEKSLKQMVDYIKDLAKKQAKNGYCYVDDEEVYKWAVTYFSKSNEELNIKKTSIPIPNTKKEENKQVIPEKETHGQLTLFDMV